MDCVTGSPMADTCVRQVVPGRWGGEAAATGSAQAGFSSPGGVVGILKRAGGMFWLVRCVLWGLGGGRAGDIATEPRAIAAWTCRGLPTRVPTIWRRGG